GRKGGLRPRGRALTSLWNDVWVDQIGRNCHVLEIVIEHQLTVEEKPAGKVSAREQQRHPERIVLPHRRVGNVVDGGPERTRFGRFSWHTGEGAGTKHVHEDRVTVDEL